MDMIQLARELGKELQRDDSYIKMSLAQQTADEDEQLQELIETYNAKRIAINSEASKPDRDDEKLKALNKEMRSAYVQIMKNENMASYNIAKQEFDVKLRRVIAIINNSAQGENPEYTDYGDACSGGCDTCGGCG